MRAAKDCDKREDCVNRKCIKDKGETSDTCCRGCGCTGGLICKDSACVEKEKAEEDRLQLPQSRSKTSTLWRILEVKNSTYSI